MPTTDVEQIDAPVSGSEVLICAVCEHELSKHDTIARRYCEATKARALSRGCLCRSV
jgi:hypothetical protein